MEQVEIYVAAHKPVSLSLPEGYRICQVNAAKNGRWQGEYAHDDDGEDNISFKNDRFSELTALYALWKNSRADIKGLAHYRRFFSAQDAMTPRNILFRTILPGDMPGAILGEEKIREYLGSADIIMEYPRFPIYCTAREDLLRFVFPEDIREMRELISREYPDYLNSCERVLRSTNISYLNMFAAKKEISDAYCQWMFSFLGKLEDRLGRVENYDAQHKRIFGYLGEVLLTVAAAAVPLALLRRRAGAKEPSPFLPLLAAVPCVVAALYALDFFFLRGFSLAAPAYVLLLAVCFLSLAAYTSRQSLLPLLLFCAAAVSAAIQHVVLPVAAIAASALFVEAAGQLRGRRYTPGPETLEAPHAGA